MEGKLSCKSSKIKYFVIKIALRGISPMVWRRLRISGNTSLATLHKCIQILYGWDDVHLHQFHIYGKDYGINYAGGFCYSDNPHTVYLDDFFFEVGDKFTYEYNFFENIMHDIRIEKIQEFPKAEHTIVCLSGSGMPGATQYDVAKVKHKMLRLVVAKKGRLTEKNIVRFREKLNQVEFNKNHVNSGLASSIKTE